MAMIPGLILPRIAPRLDPLPRYGKKIIPIFLLRLGYSDSRRPSLFTDSNRVISTLGIGRARIMGEGGDSLVEFVH